MLIYFNVELDFISEAPTAIAGGAFDFFKGAGRMDAAGADWLVIGL